MEFIAVLLACLWLSTAASEEKGVVSVVVVGGTGDLAKKYLWQGFFDLYYTAGDLDFQFVSGSRAKQEDGDKTMQNILTERVQCRTEDETCLDALGKYRNLVSYRQLKASSHYSDLCKQLNEEGGGREAGRIFYLSIPPRAYKDTVNWINEHCRPSNHGAWLRVVLEKPFGRDAASAQTLARALEAHLAEHEMFRVDHYLGKAGARQIIPFRAANRAVLDKLLHRRHVERIEVALKETLDAEGRLSFYDDYGVVRDVLQNHLTEVMTLVTMNLPPDVGNTTALDMLKLELLAQVSSIQPEDVVAGQYEGYQLELQQEVPDRVGSKSATFAAARLRVQSTRWRGVPIILLSGKNLQERASYVKVVFRATDGCVSASLTDGREEPEDCSGRRWLLFHLGHGGLETPGVAFSKGLGTLVPSDGLEEGEVLEEVESLLGRSSDEFVYYGVKSNRDAYSSLIESVYRGRRSEFVTTPRLTESWRIWSPVVEELEGRAPKVYRTASDLNFDVLGDSLEFVSGEDIREEDEKMHTSHWMNPSLPTDVFGDVLYSGSSEELYEALVEDVWKQARSSISQRGVFHMALPGGSSPLPLFKLLADLVSFPWRQTHIWQVDERCVALDDAESNFYLLDRFLIQRIRIPYANVHPILDRNFDEGGKCKPEAATYSMLMRDVLPEGSQLDLVVLGGGRDGHVASLFPHSPLLAAAATSSVSVTTADAPPEVEVRRRVTLTLGAIQHARRVALIVTGAHKREVMRSLLSSAPHNPWIPASCVSAARGGGQVVWYAQHTTLFGES